MYVQVGSYQTPNNSAWNIIDVRTKVSPRGRIISQNYVWEVSCILGLGGATTQAQLTTLILAHEAGMKQNNVDMAFYEDDGTVTAHAISNAATANGITFLGIRYPGYFSPANLGAGSEYAEGAAIRYVVTRHQAEVLDVEDGILFYQQSMQFSLGGFDYEVLEALSGPPQTQITKLQSRFWGVQSGSAVSAFATPNTPSPIVGIPPKPDRSWVRAITPSNQGRQRNYGYGLAWYYYFLSPGPLTAIPPENP